MKDEGAMRICVDGKWYASCASNDVSTCTTESLKDSSGVKIICGGDSVGVVLNGVNGMDGVDGAKGDDGADGTSGSATAGADGKDGLNGIDGKDGVSCSAVTLADNSGLKVLCGGDSVGVVLNGTNGSNGYDGTNGENGKDGKDGSSCSLVTIDCIINVACGKDTVSLDVIASDDVCRGTAIVDSEKVAIVVDTLSGATQKGPFLSGSKISIRELSDGRSLAQTGNAFEGKIQNDNGQFKITARMLVSQYVTLHAEGYYRNEITGKNSSSTLMLQAITDVNQRNIVNVNLLTHLEYDRVFYLVTKKKMTVKAAKKQAQKEILNLLNIDNTNFSSSEDLNIAGASDEDGALLAFSIMLQGDRSVSELTELLTKISSDMEEDGTWDDSSTKLAIANWTKAADTSGRLDTIRKNVENWGLSSVVPNFEKYARNFWRVEFGLGKCGDADSVEVGSVVKTAKSSSHFTCAKVAGDVRWRIATDFEKDTYGWTVAADGVKKSGDVTGTVYVYDSLGIQTSGGVAGWRKAIGIEEIQGGCRKELFGEIRSYRGRNDAGYYRCGEKTHKWVLESNNLAIDTQKWTEGEDGYAKWGDSITTNCYVYDTAEEYKGWRQGNSTDCSLGLMGCTQAVQAMGKMLYSEKDGNYYMCKDNSWKRVDDDIQKNTYTLTCNSENDGSVVLGTADTWYYACDGGEWRKASQAEYEACYVDGVCSACVSTRQGEFIISSETEYVCDKKEWRIANEAEHEKQSLCTEANEGDIIYDLETTGVPTDWICKDNSWQKAGIYDYTLEQWEIHLDNHQPAGITFGELLDERDGRTYRTVKIGDQVWMAENLKYADSTSTMNLKANSWCYNNDSTKCNMMGRYYTWTAAMDINSTYQDKDVPAGMINAPHRGICPEGWHIPTGDEWNTMNGNSGGWAAQQMTGSVGWPNATNASGFSALPVGRYYDGYFNLVGSDAFFWSATESNSNGADNWYMNASDARLYNYYYGSYIGGDKGRGFAIRCLQD